MYLPVSAVFLLLMIPCLAQGAAFQIFEQSAASVASAATNQAEAKDASAIFWNPASLALLEDHSFAGNFELLLPTGELENIAARTTVGNIPISGSNGSSPGSLTPSASIYYAGKYSSDISYGLSLTVPFGLRAHYDNGWQGRYQALESGLINIDAGFSGAYRITPSISVGAGVDVQYARAMFASAIDLSTACLATAASVPGLFAQCAANGFVSPGNVAADGRAEVTGDSWAPGWNVGLMWHPSPEMRFGLSYRSKVTHDLDGEAKYSKPSNLPNTVATLAALSDTGVKSTLVLPDSASVSAYFGPTENVGLMASATWVHWSRLSEIRTQYDNGAADSVINLQWKNTWRVGGSMTYRVSPELTLRGGLAYDQTPTTSPQLQSLFMPDGSRWVVGIGGSYVLSDNSSIDVGYTDYKYEKVLIESSSPASGTFQGTFPGPNIHVISIQYNTKI